MNESGLTMTIDRANFDQATRVLLQGVDNFLPVAGDIAQLVENSVRRNFREGGRPDRWPASKRAYDQAAYGNASGQTLVDTARLMNSIIGMGSSEAVRVGTNVDYAAAHNFGVDEQITQQVREHVRRITQAFGKPIALQEVTVKPHSRKVHMKLPARPFMLIQDEDWADIADVITINLQKLFNRS